MLEVVIVELAKAVLAGATGEIGARPINAVLDALLHTNADDFEALSRIDRNVEDLRQGPFNAGVTFLEEARKAHRDKAGRLRDLENAREQFILALGNEHSNPARSAWIRVHLSITAHALDQYVDAEDHLERAYDSLNAGYVPPKQETGIWSILGATTIPGNAALLLPYVTAVTRLRMSLGALPTSVPHVQPTISGSLRVVSWVEVPLRPDQRRRSRALRYQDTGPVRRLAPGRPVGGSLPAIARRYPSDLVRLWDPLLRVRSSELLRIASGAEPGPGYDRLLLRPQSDRRPPRWYPHELDNLRRVARDIVAERRSGWPAYQKHALPNDVKRLLWPVQKPVPAPGGATKPAASTRLASRPAQRQIPPGARRRPS